MTSTPAPLGFCCGRADGFAGGVDAWFRPSMYRCGDTVGPKPAHLLASKAPARPRDEAKGRWSARFWRKPPRGFERCRRQLGARTTGLLAPTIGAALCLAGCTAKQPVDAAPAYYRYDFPQAAELLREPASMNDDNVILDNVRLGLAAMAEGDTAESEVALGRAFELLSTAGLNADRTTAAVLFYEGVRIWKGEPFEQALAYYWTAVNYATIGSWDNARAAAANSLFRLTDFGRDMTQQQLARKASQDDQYLEKGYTAVDTSFALGFLMQAIATDLSGTSGSAELFKAAKQIDPALGPIIATLEARRYDTLLLVDFGRGPRKIATGPDNAIAEFRAVERHLGPLSVSVDGGAAASFPPACDVNTMARDHRWNNLEDVRRAKSFLGTGLLVGGAATTAIGADQGSGAAVGIGVGLIALGALLKASAYADTRYMDFAPARIFVVPLLLERPATLTLRVGAGGAPLILPDVAPGSVDRPRAIYVRFFGSGSPAPPMPISPTDPAGPFAFADPHPFVWLTSAAPSSN